MTTSQELLKPKEGITMEPNQKISDEMFKSLEAIRSALSAASIKVNVQKQYLPAEDYKALSDCYGTICAMIEKHV
jgi:hypothetical protein